MALVVGGIARYALNGTYQGRPWVNIVDMHIDVQQPIIGDREAAIYDTAGEILNAWVDDLAEGYVSDATLDSVTWVDLDSATGSTGERVSTDKYTLPQAGTSSGEPLASNAAVLVTKQTQSARGSRNGRMYLTGVSEAATDGSELTALGLTNRQANLDDFLDTINSEPLLATYSRSMAVVHTTGPNPQTGTRSQVEALVVNQRLATQRRRLRA